MRSSEHIGRSLDSDESPGHVIEGLVLSMSVIGLFTTIERFRVDFGRSKFPMKLRLALLLAATVQPVLHGQAGLVHV